MKNFKIIILVLLFVNGVNAQQKQQKDFVYYNAKIDSIVSELSTETHTYQDVYSIFSGADLNELERVKVAQKIKKMFEEEKYTNLYILGHSLIARMWNIYPKVNTTKVNQQLLELYLKYYFYPTKNSDDAYVIDSYYYDLNRQKNYTVTSKKRILEILKGEKTENEFELWLRYKKSFPPDTEYWRKVAERLMKKRKIRNDTILIQIIDSLVTDVKYSSAKQDFDNLEISNYLILMTGFLDMKECIPVLQSQLQIAIENDDMWKRRERAIRFALARLGDKEQRNYVMENMMSYKQYFNRDYFSYFRDDEMMWKFIDVNYHSKETIKIYSIGDGISSGLKTMSDVYPYVKNVPEELAYPYISNDINDDYKWAKDFYEWLTANKSKIKFDYDGEKKGFW
jgi:hypothetical protein